MIFVALCWLFYRLFQRELAYIQHGRIYIEGILFLCMLSDAATQTTFDSVPTAAIFAVVLASRLANLKWRDDVSAGWSAKNARI